MPRNAEMIRQWKVLLALESHRFGRTITELAELLSVTTRTIRRDLEALQEAGFPVYDQDVDHHRRWKLDALPLRSFAETGLSLAELSALYFSRTLVECLTASAFQADVRSAFDKLAKLLPPKMRRYLGVLPAVMGVKREPGRKVEPGNGHESLQKLVSATLEHRKATIRYYSFAHRRVKDYQVEPYRLTYAQGGLYLIAFVPEYGQMRTFAIERIQRLQISEETFGPVQPSPDGTFDDSLGIHHGKPERVEIEFASAVAPYIQERVWHESQKITARPDGSLTLVMNVCTDWALQGWVLSFGPAARVVAPRKLAARILEEIEEARTRYLPRLPFDAAPGSSGDRAQRRLPLGSRRSARTRPSRTATGGSTPPGRRPQG